VLDVLEVRSMIEIEAAGLAAHRRDPAALQELDGALARMANSIYNPVANVEADMEFHRVLAAGTGNPVLALVLQPILAPIQTGMLRGTRLSEATERALDEHRHIRNAVADGDADAARAAMRNHMHTARVEVSTYAHPMAEDVPGILGGRAATPRAATRRRDGRG
jgi:DNA-binding FadR family transcriptional regulator